MELGDKPLLQTLRKRLGGLRHIGRKVPEQGRKLLASSLILMKEKGSEEPFRQVNLTDFIGETVLPTFDHTIKWRRLVDRPTRRRVTSSRSPSPDPANRKVSPQKPQLNKQLRQLSLTGKDTSVNKRQRQNEMDTTEDLNITQ